MASSSSRSGERMIHQDFIARIRFSNALPPPPNPPKLLDIPNTGLASGQYTQPGFASRLAREQALNIEADAELGMPLDLVGMPGIFDGDESSIQAPAQQPHIHPHDRALLRPLSTLGKPKIGEASVSFLRRTEYISSAAGKRHESALRSLNTPNKRPLKRPSPEPDKDSPAYIKRKIDQSFAYADANLKDRSRVKHPSKKNLKLVDASPLLPDLDAFPDSGAYVTVRFLNNPVASSKTYDTRLLNGIFKPIEKSPAEDVAYEAALEAYERDPHNNPKPSNVMNYDYYLSNSTSGGAQFREKFDVENPDNDDDRLYTHNRDDRPCFQFGHVRAYETATESELDHTTKYDEELILAPRDGKVFYYPVMQRSTIRPQRTRAIARTIGLEDDDEQVVDQLDVTVQEPTEDVKQVMEAFKDNPYGPVEEEEEVPEADEEQSAHLNGGGARETVETNGRGSQESEEEDAEGDEEE